MDVPQAKNGHLTLKSYSNKRTFSWHSSFDGHRFLQVRSHFRGFEPQLSRFFFLKSDIKWAFFISSNTLESYVTNLKVRTTSKLKNLYKNEQNSNRDLFVQYTKVVLYSIHNKLIGNFIEQPTSSQCIGQHTGLLIY